MDPVLKVIHSRKSVRKYTGEAVSREEILTLVHAGMAAPCSYSKACWYFVVIDDPKVIARLVEGMPNAKMLESSRHAIVVMADLKLSHGGAEVPYWIQDCSATVENILLAAEATGLGACWLGTHPRPERVAHVRQILGAPEHVVPLAVVSVGRASGEEKPKNKIDPTRVFFNAWNKSS